ncbi:PREDICTED: cancer/testis antigen 55-like [Colobus angolensis palliatus]|uniref:cancer/testis antigen 55-like n=1 Tax=Colobus angolensis palliatus TaxID=336983 RepID=UPI0005F517FC|nr:PREDICTED: cancer/testis antigen 55-like [Colobus angolensis palliatus]
MSGLLRSALAFFQSTADPTEQQRPQQQGPQQQGDTELTTVQGVVTSLCDDYGMIDQSIYFSSDVVTGDVPLKVGQKVNVVVEEDEPFYGLRAIKVDVVPHPLDSDEPSDSKIRVLNGCVTSISEDTIYISNIIYFPKDTVSGDFVPYKGDWLKVEYSTEPGFSNFKASSVKPTRCIHVEEVRITHIRGRNGVISNNIFFTLDSVKLPDGYVPKVDDIVNVVKVESTQFCFKWRAVSITPAQKSSSRFQDDGGLGQP